MQGLMMDRPLLISTLLQHAESTYPKTEIVSRRCEGDIHRYTMKDAAARARKVANLLKKLPSFRVVLRNLGIRCGAAYH